MDSTKEKLELMMCPYVDFNSYLLQPQGSTAKITLKIILLMERDLALRNSIVFTKRNTL